MGRPLSDEYPQWLKEWRKEGREPRKAKYYHQLYVARPPWCDMSEVRSIYRECERRRKRGENVQVHHIVPLFSSRVCGLDTPDNLCIVTEQENQALSNHTWPDQWEEQLLLDIPEWLLDPQMKLDF